MHDHIACKLPHVILLFRLEAMREITLSGFQLELYAPAERPHAYWYAAKIIEAQLECYDELLPFLPDNSKPYHEMDFRHRFLLALGALCSAMFLVTRVLVPLEWEETQHAFCRRWKWAYRPDYERIRAAPVAHPDLYEFFQSMDVRVYLSLRAKQTSDKTFPSGRDDISCRADCFCEGCNRRVAIL